MQRYPLDVPWSLITAYWLRPLPQDSRPMPSGDRNDSDQGSGRPAGRQGSRPRRRRSQTDSRSRNSRGDQEDSSPWPKSRGERQEGRRKSRMDPDLRVVPADDIAVKDVDEDALRVISRLQRHGYEAYLVGGCVRDLMLGRKPKDFDVATDAHPRQIKRLFRNGRIIGRRFRLVHIVYGDQVIETATFRREPPAAKGDADLLIVEDNEYGSAVEDARRRDFTVNGLFLDPARWEILDYVGGLRDLEAGVLRTIGEPAVRLAEDPVRIMRAIKFATRLGIRIGDRTWEAMCNQAQELVRSAPPRVFEEILRLLRSGTALGAFRMMRKNGALAALFPEIDQFLGAKDDPDPKAHDRADSYWRLLEALDADVHSGRIPDTPVLVAVLFLRLLEHEQELAFEEGAEEDIDELLDIVVGPYAERARIPRRMLESTRRVLLAQRRFTQPVTKNFRPLRFVRSPEFKDALALFRLRSAAWGQGWDVYEGWLRRYEESKSMPPEELEELSGDKRRRRPRRRRR